MESNRKRKGFMKGKLVMSICKATKPSSTVAYGSKMKPGPLPSAAGGFIVNQDHVVTQAKQKVPHHPRVEFIVNQDQVVPQPNQKVSFLLSADGGGLDSYGIIHDSLYGVPVDEGVDTKAATYISTVRERFKLQRINSEHKKLQDMHQQQQGLQA